MPTNHFPFVGTHFKTHLGFQRDGNAFGSGFPIGARSALLVYGYKGDRVPLAVVSKGGSAALAGGIQWRTAPLSGRKNPKKPGFCGTRLCAQSRVCYTFCNCGWLKGVVGARTPSEWQSVSNHTKQHYCISCWTICSAHFVALA